MSTNKTKGEYDALSPWAEVDLIPLKGLAPRVKGLLTGKKIGLFCNDKRGAYPTAMVVAEQLKAKYPTIEFTHFLRVGNVSVIDTEMKDKYEEWLKGVDAAIFFYGD